MVISNSVIDDPKKIRISISSILEYERSIKDERNFTKGRTSSSERYSFRSGLGDHPHDTFEVQDKPHLIYLLNHDWEQLDRPSRVKIWLNDDTSYGHLILTVIVIPLEQMESEDILIPRKKPLPRISLLPTTWFKWIMMIQNNLIWNWEHVEIPIGSTVNIQIQTYTETSIEKKNMSLQIHLRPLTIYPWTPLTENLLKSSERVKRSREYEHALAWSQSVQKLVDSQHLEPDNLVCIPKNNRLGIFKIDSITPIPGDESALQFILHNPKFPWNSFCDADLYRSQTIPMYLQQVLEDLEENLDALFRQNQRYQRLNIYPIQGAYLRGSPGAGRRRMIRYLANKIGARLFTISMTEVVSWYHHGSDGISPLERLVVRAYLCAPSIMILEGFDLIQADSKHLDVKSISSHIISKLSILSNHPVFVFATLSCDISRLPTALHVNHISNASHDSQTSSGHWFGASFDIPIPVSIDDRQQMIQNLWNDLVPDMKLPSSTLDKLAIDTTGHTLQQLETLMEHVSFLLHKTGIKCIEGVELEEIIEHALNSVTSQINGQESQSGTLNFGHVKRFQTSWDDIFGYNGVKKKLKHWIELTRQDMAPRLKRLGMNAPTGLLLFGPSGCGKTLLMKALATASHRTCISLQLKDIYSKYLGESEEAIRHIFATARRLAPSMILLDNLEAIGMRRGWTSSGSDSSSSVNERVLSTLLNELDGIQDREGVLVIGCTNQPWQIDDALLRPGRLDEHVFVTIPDEESRTNLLQQLLPANMRERFETEDISQVVEWTDGFTPADLTALIRESIYLCMRRLQSSPKPASSADISINQVYSEWNIDDLLAALQGGMVVPLLSHHPQDVLGWWAPKRISREELDRYERFSLTFT